MTIANFTNSTIRDHATSKSFERGEGYFWQGAVGALVVRGERLEGEVEGSQYEPYRVQVSFDQAGITDTYCTCPYDWGGWCKHIVAVLLAYLDDPKAVEERASLESQIKALEAQQLQALLLRLLDTPAITDLIERELKRIEATSLVPRHPDGRKEGKEEPPANESSAKRRTAVDPTPFRQQVSRLLSELQQMRPSVAYYQPPLNPPQSWGGIGGTIGKIRALLQQVQGFIEGGDGHNALLILDAMTSEYVKEWHQIDGSSGETGDFFDELGKIWTEAVVATELTQEEGQEWAGKLADWQEDIGDYGYEDAFSAAQEVACYGWNDDALEEMLDATELDHEQKPSYQYADQVAITRLKVLERQERYDDYLRIAKRVTQPGYYLTMLVRVGRIQDAVDEALQRMTSPGQALTLAQALRDRDALDEALYVAQYGLTLKTNGATRYFIGGSYDSTFSGSNAMLATWLCDLAQSMGKAEQALSAATIAFHESPSLFAYLKVQELAGKQWLAHRIDLLTYLRQHTGYITQARVDIFLHEGLIDDAIKAVSDDSPLKSHLEQVISAAIQSRPQWVIQTAQAQAQRIIDTAKAKDYHHASTWLKHARDAYLAAGREREWQSYLDGIRQQHKRKYKLMGVLREL
jgi:uncharacterized Zn finger protein